MVEPILSRVAPFSRLNGALKLAVAAILKFQIQNCVEFCYKLYFF